MSLGSWRHGMQAHQARLIKALLKCGGNPRLPDSQGLTPLHQASYYAAGAGVGSGRKCVWHFQPAACCVHSKRCSAAHGDLLVPGRLRARGQLPCSCGHAHLKLQGACPTERSRRALVSAASTPAETIRLLVEAGADPLVHNGMHPSRWR